MAGQRSVTRGDRRAGKAAVPLSVFHDLSERMLTGGTFECATIVVRLVRFDAEKPHRCATVGARRSRKNKPCRIE